MSTSVTIAEPEENDRLLSIEAAAEILGISPWTVRKWVAEKKIRSCKLGTRRLIPASEVQRVIKESLVDRTL